MSKIVRQHQTWCFCKFGVDLMTWWRQIIKIIIITHIAHIFNVTVQSIVHKIGG